MKELILQALSRFLYKLRGLFVEKTELKKYAKKPKTEYVVGRAIPVNPKPQYRYFFRGRAIVLKLGLELVKEIAKIDPDLYVLFKGKEKSVSEVARDEMEGAYKYIGIGNADSRNPIYACYKNGCDQGTIARDIQEGGFGGFGGRKLDEVILNHLYVEECSDLTTNTTSPYLKIRRGVVICTKTPDLAYRQNLLDYPAEYGGCAAATERKGYLKDLKKVRFRMIRRAWKRGGCTKWKLQRVSKKRIEAGWGGKICVIPYHRHRRGIPTWYYYHNQEIRFQA